jgi:hypothetical protein
MAKPIARRMPHRAHANALEIQPDRFRYVRLRPVTGHAVRYRGIAGHLGQARRGAGKVLDELACRQARAPSGIGGARGDAGAKCVTGKDQL